MTEADWLRVMSGEARGASASVLRAALACAEPLYAVAMSARNALYERGLKPSVSLSQPTISVGNITTGGTGKTPVVREVVRVLEASGHRPAVLMRGYRKAGADESDELAEYRELGVRAIANPDRAAGGDEAMTRWPETDAFVLDDGFQHHRVKRDLDLVLIDATRPWGFGHVLPRGLLRESRGGLRRAGAVIVTRADQVSEQDLAALDREIEQWHGVRPIAHVYHAWTRWHGATGEWIRVAPTWVMCGIGNSDAFFTQCRAHLSRVVAHRAFSDHHTYDAQNVATLLRLAREAGAEAVVTTMKDWVKLKPLWPLDGLPVAVPEVGIAFLDGADAFAELLSTFSLTLHRKDA